MVGVYNPGVYDPLSASSSRAGGHNLAYGHSLANGHSLAYGHNLAYLRSLDKEAKAPPFAPNCALGEIVGTSKEHSNGEAETFWLQNPAALVQSWALPSRDMPWPALLNSLMRLALLLTFLLWAFRLPGWWLPLAGGLLLAGLGGLLTVPLRVAPEGGVKVLDLGFRPLEESRVR